MHGQTKINVTFLCKFETPRNLRR